MRSRFNLQIVRSVVRRLVHRACHEAGARGVGEVMDEFSRYQEEAQDVLDALGAISEEPSLWTEIIARTVADNADDRRLRRKRMEGKPATQRQVRFLNKHEVLDAEIAALNRSEADQLIGSIIENDRRSKRG